MADSGEQCPDRLSHDDAPEPRTRFDANATGAARVYQAARDLHFHYRDGVREARRAESADIVDECPYPGLFAFDRQHARWFHGRDRLIARLIARLDGRLRRGGPLVVVGASGAGKSSLLQAGLVPALGKGALPGSRHWPCVLCTPTADPIAALTTAVRERIGSDVTGQAMRDAIGRDDARVVIVVDQLEELFTQCQNALQRLDFLNLLDDLASACPDGRPPVALVVYGLRADFYARCADYPALRDAVQDDHVLVGPLSAAELREAILYPVEDVGLDIEPGLVELLLADIGVMSVPDAEGGYPAGRLPLLAHALRGTWQRRDGNTLTVAAYRATGGIDEAIATTADAVFARLSPAGQEAARAMFLRLVRIGENTQDTRKRVPKAELLARHDDIASPVVDPFTDNRLLTADRDTVEITHEALLDAWPRLRDWINTDRAGNLLRQQVDEGATAWERNQQDTALLYRGRRLAAAREWADGPHDKDMSPAARAFLDGTISMWQVRANIITVIGSLVASDTTAIAFSPDSDLLAAGGHDGTVRVWNLDVQSAARRICAATPRLSAAQWQEYIPEQLGSTRVVDVSA